MNAANRYIATIYEACVDKQLDVEAIRLYLAAKGIARSPAMVARDLEHTFEFVGYVESHPAPAAVSVQKWDITALPQRVCCPLVFRYSRS
jgi:hypothetical protein